MHPPENPTNGGANDNGQMSCLVFTLAVIGAYALCWWLIDNVRSIMQLLVAVLMPYFQPQEDVSMVQRFGEWAGKTFDRPMSRNWCF